jgi:hypothetical protein
MRPVGTNRGPTQMFCVGLQGKVSSVIWDTYGPRSRKAGGMRGKCIRPNNRDLGSGSCGDLCNA